VEVGNLIKVIKEYSVTRAGSREIYVFFVQVAEACFEDIKKNREFLNTLATVYEKSNLCSAEFLEKIIRNLE
jgi:hypothetical protein